MRSQALRQRAVMAMDEAALGSDQQRRTKEQLPLTSAAYEGRPADIAHARGLARGFLGQVQAQRGLPLSRRVMDGVQLVVSELMTNACKYAPGPCMLDLRLTEGSISITVWDSHPVLPVAKAADLGRVGQHGLEIVMAVCQGFEVYREQAGKRTTASVMMADDSDGDVTGRTIPEPARTWRRS